MITNTLATIGGIVLGILALIALYFVGGVFLLLLDEFLNKLRGKIFYLGGGESNVKENHYLPPQPPWDRLRYEIERLRYYVECMKVIYGVSKRKGWKLNDIDQMYEQREEHYGNE